MTGAELQTFLQTLGYGTDTATEELAAINSVGREITGLRGWQWSIASADLVTTAGVEWITLPTNYRRPRAAYLNDTVIDYDDFEYLTAERFNEIRGSIAIPASATRGTPRYWTIYGGLVYLTPVPNLSTFVVRLSYHSKWTDLTAGTSPPWNSDYHDILAYGAAVNLAIRDRDWQASDRFAQIYNRKLNNLIVEDRMDQQADQVDRSYWDAWDTPDDDSLI